MTSIFGQPGRLLMEMLPFLIDLRLNANKNESMIIVQITIFFWVFFSGKNSKIVQAQNYFFAV